MAVKARGNGKFDVELKGRYIRRCSTEAAANKLYAAALYKCEIGVPVDDVVAELKGRPGGNGSEAVPKLEDYFPIWLADGCGTDNERSRTRYRNAYKRVAVHVGDKRLDELTSHRELKELVNHLKKDYAAHTVNQSITVLKAVLYEALQDGIITEAPPRKLKALPKAKRVRKPNVITREQHRQLVELMPERMKPMVALWPLVGLRRGEMIALEWRDVDLEDRRLWVRRQRTDSREIVPPKYGSERYVDLCDDAVDLLAEWRERNPLDLVFPGQGGGYIAFTTLGDHLPVAGNAVGLERHTSHDYRHTFGSWLIEAGCSVLYVAGRMGHQDGGAELLRTYAHEIERADRRAPQLFDDWLRGHSGDGSS